MQAPLINGRRRQQDLFSSRDEQQHGQLKRLVSSTYSMQNLKSMEQLVDETLLSFFNILHKEYEQKNQVIDLGVWLR